MPPGLVCDDLSGIYPPRQGYRIHFRGGVLIWRSGTPNEWMIMRMVAGRGNLQFHVDCKTQLGTCVLHMPKVLSLTDMMSSLCKNKNPHTDVSGLNPEPLE
jgi:hypothetical protein